MLPEWHKSGNCGRATRRTPISNFAWKTPVPTTSIGRVAGIPYLRPLSEYLGGFRMVIFGNGALNRPGPRKLGVLAGVAFAMTMSASSGAFAQCTGPLPTGPGAPFFGAQLSAAAAAGGAASGAFAGALGNMSTAFLSQQG